MTPVSTKTAKISPETAHLKMLYRLCLLGAVISYLLLGFLIAQWWTDLAPFPLALPIVMLQWPINIYLCRTMIKSQLRMERELEAARRAARDHVLPSCVSTETHNGE